MDPMNEHTAENDVRLEWEVAWFPPDESDQTRTYQSEAKARDRYAVARELGHCPILSRRTVTVSEWVMVESDVPESARVIPPGESVTPR